jgi:adenosylcobinamide-GDP ribazoletransferase
VGLLTCEKIAGTPPVAVGVLLSASVTLWLARKFVRRLGGYTGDLLGATQQASELAFYLGLACLLA